MLFLLLSVARIVSAGPVGVTVLFGKVGESELAEGLHFVNPLVKVVQMSIRTEEYTMVSQTGEGEVQGDDAIDALSKDGSKLTMELTIWYRLEPSAAPTVFRTLGPNYVSKIVRPAVRTAIREATKDYEAMEAFSTRRDELTLAVQGRLEVALTHRGILVERPNIRNITLPSRLQDAINKKLAAQQAAEEMEFVLEKEVQLKEVRIVEAEGLAEAQGIIDQSLTPAYLQWKYIESLQMLVNSPNNSTVILPFDQQLIPLLNLPSGGSGGGSGNNPFGR